MCFINIFCRNTGMGEVNIPSLVSVMYISNYVHCTYVHVHCILVFVTSFFI